MDEYPPNKRMKLMNSSNYKIRIVEEFDRKINQIDIDAETILMSQSKNDSKNSIETVNQTRKLLIEEIEKIKNSNLNHLNKLPASSQDVEIENKDLFVKHCVFLDNTIAREFAANKDTLGILIVTDFFIPTSQANALKYYHLTSFIFLIFINTKIVLKEDDSKIF